MTSVSGGEKKHLVKLSMSVYNAGIDVVLSLLE